MIAEDTMTDARSPRSFLDIFDSVYAPVLGGRRVTFRKVFEVLEAQRLPFYTIVETGTAHIPDGAGAPGDYAVQGNSTLLFDAFVTAHDGVVWSVDCSPEHCAQARQWVSGRVRVVCSDSRRFLAGIDAFAWTPVNCLYLDSIDIDWQNPHPSALHHREELRAALPSLAASCVVFVDDSPQRLGKAGYVVEFMEQLGATLLFEDYQIGWMLPDPVPPPPMRAPGDPLEVAFMQWFREARRYRYVRVGFDERILELLPGGPIGDGRDRCEQHWFVEHTTSGLELILAGVGQVTCRLTCAPDGVWRGRWCSHERMPVELRPIS